MSNEETVYADDGFSWRHSLVTPYRDDRGFRHFSMEIPPRDDGRVERSPLLRFGHLALYIQRCRDGQGENFLHAHSDEAGWLVLEGEAVFYDGRGEVIATVRGGEGLGIDPGTPYRYVCSGPETVMVRAAARAQGTS